MGFAEMLARLGIPYDSRDAVQIAEKIMKFIRDESRNKSVELGEKRGVFPNFEGSTLNLRMRNATLNTVAPTGTISIIAGTSSGIEPFFAISFIRNVMGTQLLETIPVFEEIAKERGFYSTDLMIEISKKGSIQNIKGIPGDVKRIFVTSFDIEPDWHVKMQAAFQKYVDNAVAKTVNLPSDATLEDVRRIFLLAHTLKCKGITVYRYGSKPKQVLTIGQSNIVIAGSEYSGGCPSGVCPL
jgi:ribonucleoside-diphosphate reductase alpha chain